MPAQPERITLRKIWEQILEQLNLERGLGYTVKEFLLRPGKALEEYFYEDRQRYIKPFSFLLLTTAITTFLMIELVIHKDQALQDITTINGWEKIPEVFQPGIILLSEWLDKYFNLFYLASLPLVTLASFWVFRKSHPFNLAEHLILNTYIFGIQSIFYIFNIPFIARQSQAIWSIIPSGLIVFYFVFAYKRIFRLNIWRALLYTTLVYLIAQILNAGVLGLVILIGALFA